MKLVMKIFTFTLFGVVGFLILLLKPNLLQDPVSGFFVIGVLSITLL